MLGRIFTTLEGLLREGRANLAAVDPTGNISFVREDDDVDYEDEAGQNTYDADADADAMDTVRCLLCMELVIVAVVGFFLFSDSACVVPSFLCARWECRMGRLPRATPTCSWRRSSSPAAVRMTKKTASWRTRK
jgi:hypothetical protein